MADPAAEADGGTLRLDFDRRLMLQFRGSAMSNPVDLAANGGWLRSEIRCAPPRRNGR
jgi:hypothetical protein